MIQYIIFKYNKQKQYKKIKDVHINRFYYINTFEYYRYGYTSRSDFIKQQHVNKANQLLEIHRPNIERLIFKQHDEADAVLLYFYVMYKYFGLKDIGVRIYNKEEVM